MKRTRVLHLPSRGPSVPVVRALVGALSVLLLTSCGSADSTGRDVPADPLAAKPAPATVRSLGEGFTIEFFDDTPVSDLWWSLDVIYDTGDEDAVFTHYEGLLGTLGFTVVSEVKRAGEISAVYGHASTGVEATLRTRRDGSRVRVDLEFEHLGSFAPPTPGFSLAGFQGMEMTLFDGADVIDLEWAFAFAHGSRGSEAVFPFYDGQLTGQNWTQVELDDGEDFERESEYVRDGVYMELKAFGDTRVEIEVNKLRFYQD